MRRSLTRIWLAACAVGMLAGATPVLADDAQRGQPLTEWQDLSPEQQRVLGQSRAARTRQ
jgi:hypothetical protein